MKKMHLKALVLTNLAVALAAVMLLAFAVMPSVNNPTHSIMSFDQALKAAENPADPKNFISYTTTGELEGNQFFEQSGIMGYLVWLAPNGTIYQADYPSGKAQKELMQTFQTNWNPPEGYYIWILNYEIGETIWVEAENATILNHTPRR